MYIYICIFSLSGVLTSNKQRWHSNNTRLNKQHVTRNSTTAAILQAIRNKLQATATQLQYSQPSLLATFCYELHVPAKSYSKIATITQATSDKHLTTATYQACSPSKQNDTWL